jgi:hypothetical protein
MFRAARDRATAGEERVYWTNLIGLRTERQEALKAAFGRG